jgi:hypothetical protein
MTLESTRRDRSTTFCSRWGGDDVWRPPAWWRLSFGYELSVAAIAAAYISQSLAGGFSVGNPANTTVLLLAVAAIGMLMLGVGLRFARRYDAAVR